MKSKSLKTPLRYPGGKSRACTKMKEHFPDLRDYVEYREPFMGGGSVALYVHSMHPHLEVWVNDLYEPLVNFWLQLQSSGKELKDELDNLKKAHPNEDSSRCLFIEAKDIVNNKDKDDFERAVAFYIVNTCSFSGLTESSSFSKQASSSNFSFRGIDKLPEYSKLIESWTITNHPYFHLMTENLHDGIFMYLDPPYEIGSNLYGKKGDMHKTFDHDKFAHNCDIHSTDMMVSYNSSQLIRDRFKGWAVAEYEHTYTMRSVGDYMKEQQDRKELLLMNYNKPANIKLSFDTCYTYDKLKKEGLAS